MAEWVDVYVGHEGANGVGGVLAFYTTIDGHFRCGLRERALIKVDNTSNSLCS